MTYTDYGVFTPYIPDPLPEWAQANPNFAWKFAHNQEGVDFYDLRSVVQPIEEEGITFAIVHAETGRVRVAANKLDMLPNPNGERLVAIPKDDNPQALSGKILDVVTGALTDPPPPPAQPRVVSRFQARRALKDAGLFATVETMIAASGNEFLQDAWADAAEFREDSGFVQALGAELGLSDARIGAIFDAAALIVA